MTETVAAADAFEPVRGRLFGLAYRMLGSRAEAEAVVQEAWERLRETAASFGDQRIYASHKSIMFSRTSCYFFVRPKRKFLELCVFLGRTLKAPQVRRVDRASKSKVVHFIHITHRDEVEAPVTDWLQEAYELSSGPRTTSKPTPGAKTRKAKTAKAAPRTISAKKSQRR